MKRWIVSIWLQLSTGSPTSLNTSICLVFDANILSKLKVWLLSSPPIYFKNEILNIISFFLKTKCSVSDSPLTLIPSLSHFINYLQLTATCIVVSSRMLTHCPPPYSISSLLSGRQRHTTRMLLDSLWFFFDMNAQLDPPPFRLSLAGSRIMWFLSLCYALFCQNLIVCISFQFNLISHNQRILHFYK